MYIIYEVKFHHTDLQRSLNNNDYSLAAPTAGGGVINPAPGGSTFNVQMFSTRAGRGSTSGAQYQTSERPTMAMSAFVQHVVVQVVGATAPAHPYIRPSAFGTAEPACAALSLCSRVHEDNIPALPTAFPRSPTLCAFLAPSPVAAVLIHEV
ncbi:hypothetical protein HYPSUDRAFT_210020 [Hypholoma sublateritium FD-334 SS-4]|uniref:Uncharacterized protein n=1 Tax=Hypholoma sublateritium (strain FD-334 SS-4) TaxID=945553 RepID=A0A0D2N7Z7_HYPSF|nr:hypothetical protein HYPSUDRAFT_210020 [Hypholoma sublateritium FD-334 SS-4]